MSQPLAAPPTERLPALDWLRGLVMAVMTVDHCDQAMDPAHAAGDSAMMPGPRVLPAAEFLTRWCTHLCAPTFVFLAGAGIALSVANARQRGATGWAIDRHLLLRGIVLIALECTLVSMYWRREMGDPLHWLPIILQVIWALGAGMAAMALLRRGPSAVLLGLAVVLLVGCEWLNAQRHGMRSTLPDALLLTGGFWWAKQTLFSAPDVVVLYPLVPWLPAMLLGLCFGRALARGARPLRTLVVGGGAALILFAVLRGIDGIGNMGLHRRSGDWLEWLHCSKYPPSVTFLAMELGLMALLLAGCFWLQQRGGVVRRWNPLLVLGQVPLFFYLLHLWLIALGRDVGVLHRPSSVATCWLAALGVVLVAWPLCAAYRWYKQRWRHAWTRYL